LTTLGGRSSSAPVASRFTSITPLPLRSRDVSIFPLPL
jgi:hypothetical protein